MKHEDLDKIQEMSPQEIEALATAEADRIKAMPESELVEQIMEVTRVIGEAGGFDVAGMQKAAMLFKIVNDKSNQATTSIEDFKLGEGFSMFAKLLNSWVVDFAKTFPEEEPDVLMSALTLIGIAAGMEWKEYLRA